MGMKLMVVLLKMSCQMKKLRARLHLYTITSIEPGLKNRTASH